MAGRDRDGRGAFVSGDRSMRALERKARGSRGHVAIATAALVLALASGCGDKTREGAAQAPAVKGGRVVFPDGSPQLAAFASEQVQATKPITHTLTGRVVWDEDRTVRVFSPFAGSVQSIRVKVGDRVAVGQILASIASPDFGQTQAEASRAAADFAVAQKNVERLRDLAANGVAAEKDLHAAEADFERARAELERVKARKKLYGGGDTVDQLYPLRAPLAGVVVEKSINPGQELRPDQMTSNVPPLFVITDPTRLWVNLDATERDLHFLRPGISVTLRTPAYPDRTFTGRIEAVSDYVDPNTRMIKVRASVANAERALKGEMFVTGEITDASGSGVLVPAQAVFLVGDRHFVFVEDGKGRYTRTEVSRAGEVSGRVAVRAGLRPGQRVVTAGSLLLQQVLDTEGGG
jgi:cobalt-zinc-cadmium efflux system membrane fusion protein